jgi:hypothetical protein
LIKEAAFMRKIKYLLMIKSTAPSLQEREKEGEAGYGIQFK